MHVALIHTVELVVVEALVLLLLLLLLVVVVVTIVHIAMWVGMELRS